MKPIKFTKDKFFDLLRFLNLLEPGTRILSISKSFMWLMLFTTLYVLIFHSDNIVAVIGASSAALISTGNYGLRRIEQRKSKNGD